MDDAVREIKFVLADEGRRDEGRGVRRCRWAKGMIRRTLCEEYQASTRLQAVDLGSFDGIPIIN